MPVSGTLHYSDAVGIREDLEDVIYRIDPTETPFISSIGTSKASAKYHEWQTQNLAAAAAAGGNALIDGADAPTASTTVTVRVGNRTQIQGKAVVVSGGLQAADTAGRANEMEYQTLLKGLELKRDMEVQAVTNGASATDNGSSTAGKMGSFESWLVTNVSRGATGASGGFSAGQVAAPTDGTARAFTETLLKTVLANAYSKGAKITTLMLDPTQKQTFSAFTGIAASRFNMTEKSNAMAKIIGAADVYVSDFGVLAVVPNIFQRHASALLISPKYVKKANFRPMKSFPLAKTGDADKREILVEWTLEVCNEAAHGIVADLT